MRVLIPNPKYVCRLSSNVDTITLLVSTYLRRKYWQCYAVNTQQHCTPSCLLFFQYRWALTLLLLNSAELIQIRDATQLIGLTSTTLGKHAVNKKVSLYCLSIVGIWISKNKQFHIISMLFLQNIGEVKLFVFVLLVQV